MSAASAVSAVPTASRRPPVTRAVFAAALVVAIAALTACEKPNPSVTVFSGTHSDHREALCWSSDAAVGVDKEDCTLSLGAHDFSERLMEQIAVIPTAAGETVGISVDPVVAENGWVLSINGRALVREPVTEKYFRFTMPPQPLRGGDAELIIQALTSNDTGIRGTWVFGLSAEG